MLPVSTAWPSPDREEQRERRAQSLDSPRHRPHARAPGGPPEGHPCPCRVSKATQRKALVLAEGKRKATGSARGVPDAAGRGAPALLAHTLSPRGAEMGRSQGALWPRRAHACAHTHTAHTAVWLPMPRELPARGRETSPRMRPRTNVRGLGVGLTAPARGPLPHGVCSPARPPVRGPRAGGTRFRPSLPEQPLTLTPALAAAAPGWGTGLWPGPRAGQKACGLPRRRQNKRADDSRGALSSRRDGKMPLSLETERAS